MEPKGWEEGESAGEEGKREVKLEEAPSVRDGREAVGVTEEGMEEGLTCAKWREE